ncbi:MAG: hypothetical protein IJG38_08905 [Thermoguttaceae bacterium]|nr:hypothetical protein [Thermoguttaceae bacterium]
MSEADYLEMNIVEKKPAPRKPVLSWKIRLPLRLMFWAFFLAGAVFYFPCLFLICIFLGLSLFIIPNIYGFMLPTFCFGIALYFHQLLKGWKKQERFPGFGYGVPAMLVVWTVGGVICVLQNWFFVLLFNTNCELCFWSLLASIFAPGLAVILGFKTYKDGGRTAALVQKTSAFLTRCKGVVIGIITLLIAASVVGQQIYYRTATRFPFLKYETSLPVGPFNHDVFWNYFAFFHTMSCPFDKFQKLESVHYTYGMNFRSLPKSTSIKEIRFRGNFNLTADDIKRMAQMPSLERLSLLFWNELKDSNSTGLEYFSQIKGLKELSLGVTTQNIDSIPYLKDVPNLETLKLYVLELDFFDSEIDYASLQSAPKLQTLILAFPDGVDEAEVQRAREALPKCKIEVEKRASSIGR